MSSAAIFAPITGRGGAVTVVRISGPETFAILNKLTPLPPLRRASLRVLRMAGAVLDHALVTIFPGPGSFTGEDCAEISLHGGRAVLAVVSDALVALGARPAEPGEFSRRAFLNNRLDLLQAEAMADLIAAETEAQRRLAVEGANALHITCTAWRETLRLIMAQQEVLIDFPDEDLPPEVEAELVAGIAALQTEMQAVLANAPRAERLREGLEFVILGAPNAGKSTLLNVLAGVEIAIVSEIPGTTRDAIGVRLDLGGVLVHVTDTAGLRESEDVIEAEGIRRAREKGAAADLIIAVAAAPEAVFPATPQGVETLYVVTKSDLGAVFDPPTMSSRAGVSRRGDPSSFTPVQRKTGLLRSARNDGEELYNLSKPKTLSVSAQSGEGMDDLARRLTAIAAQLTNMKGAPALARPRQIACVRDCANALARALEITEPELRGEELRTAANALGRLTGVIGVEEILDAVFSGFCIGK